MSKQRTPLTIAQLMEAESVRRKKLENDIKKRIRNENDAAVIFVLSKIINELV